jgi:phage baseplate assembly protein V
VAESLIEAAVQLFTNTEKRSFGVTLGQVVDNLDITCEGRVQVSLPWFPEVEPWCRVAVLSAGDGCGTFFVPQVGDEVLVAFDHGDVRDAFVLGSLWNGRDKPPADLPSDAVNRRVIRTPAGHEVVLDDTEQSIAIESSSGQKVTIDAQKIELNAGDGAAKVVLETSGNVTIEASVDLKLKGATVSVEGQTLDVKASASGTFDGGGSCTVKGGTVRIN